MLSGFPDIHRASLTLELSHVQILCFVQACHVVLPWLCAHMAAVPIFNVTVRHARTSAPFYYYKGQRLSSNLQFQNGFMEVCTICWEWTSTVQMVLYGSWFTFHFKNWRFSLCGHASDIQAMGEWSLHNYEVVFTGRVWLTDRAVGDMLVVIGWCLVVSG